MAGMLLTEKDLNELRECLELLNSIETIEYHNSNWLAKFTTNPAVCNQEKRNLIERALRVIGTSASNPNS